MSDDMRRDFWTGVLYTAIGLLFSATALTYPLGTVNRIGPGYFPLLLGGVLTILGVSLILGARGAIQKDRLFDISLDRTGLATTFFVLASVVAFAVLIRPAGLVISIVTLVVISSYASKEFRIVNALLLGVVLAAAAWAIFVLGLGLPIRPFPQFIG